MFSKDVETLEPLLGRSWYKFEEAAFHHGWNLDACWRPGVLRIIWAELWRSWWLHMRSTNLLGCSVAAGAARVGCSAAWSLVPHTTTPLTPPHAVLRARVGEKAESNGVPRNEGGIPAREGASRSDALPLWRETFGLR